ncbi:MAG TPA: pseudouridine synthase [Polyangiales bacterium]|nr:pseudouridine synthase [Polyangiales bacterium]
MSSQRLQKVLAQAGVASRRAAENLITEGRVRVNGRIVRELGARANPDKDRVEVDGRRLVAQRHVYFLMHKPREVVTTLDDPEGRKTVKDLLRNINERVFPVGRLDFQTSGALLLTNDGDLAQALLHPTRAVPKTYNAKLEGDLDQARMEQLREGVVLDDGKKTAPAEVNIIRKDGKSTSVEITISEGKNRQIHRMGEAISRSVLRLTRISFAGLTIEGLRAGQMRPLSAVEVSDLKQNYLHKTKKRRPFKAYGEMDLDESGPVSADDGELDESAPAPAWPEPKASPARRGGPREARATRYRGGADEDHAKRDDRGTRDSQATGHGAADTRVKRDAGGSRGDQATRSGRGARDDRGKRGAARDPRDEQTTGVAREAADDQATRKVRGTRDRRDGWAKPDLRARRGPSDDLAKQDDPRARGDRRDDRGKRDARDQRGSRGKRDAVDPRGSRSTRDARDSRATRDDRAERDHSTTSDLQSKRTWQDPRSTRDEHTASDPRAKRGRYPAADPRSKRDQRTAPDPRAKRGRYPASDPRSERGRHTATDPRAKRDQRTGSDPRAKRDERADYDQTEAQPRKYRGARKPPAKRTRSQSSKTKRGPAPRKSRFKR